MVSTTKTQNILFMTKKFMLYIIQIFYLMKSVGLKLLSILKVTTLFHKFMKLKIKYKAIIIGAIIASLVTYKFLFSGKSYEDIKVVETYIVSKNNLLIKTRLLGTILAKKYYLITASQNGVIDFIAEAGSKLKQGSVIVHINAPEIQKAYDTALKALEIANDQYQRELNLAKANASSKHSVEAKYMALADAQNRLSSAKVNLEKISFIAPFDGVVGSPLFYAGSKVSAETEIVAFYDPSDLVVRFDIPSRLIGELGDHTKITINGEEYTTSFIQRATSGNSYTIPAYADFKCPKCIIGEIIDVDLHITDKQNIITVPAACVFIKNGQTMVYKVKDNKVHLDTVKLGEREKDIVEILEGLDIGDIIVSQGQSRLYPEGDVKIHVPGDI